VNRGLTALLVVTLAMAAVSAVMLTRDLVPAGPSALADASDGPGDAPWNIVVIVMDTARQDRLSCYGYERETSPRLSELAGSGTLFMNAYSTSSWTAPGHASLFTGLHSATHGVTQENWSMGEDLLTFAEVLSDRGYRTAGVVENPMLVSDRGYDQGFSEYYESWRSKSPRGGEQAVDDFRKVLSGGPEEQPFLVFVNLIAPHSPYDSSGSFRNTFVTSPEIRIVSNMWRQYYTGRRSFSEDEIRHLSELYDAEILFTDYLIGEMIDELKERGLWEQTVMIVTSDHGENIGEHSHVDHVFTLFETTTKIPMLVHRPGLFPEGGTSDSPVQLTDIFPTVLELAGIDTHDFPTHGYSLLGEGPPPDREIFSEYYYPSQVLSCYGRQEFRESPMLRPYLRRIRSLTRGDLKFIWGSDGKHELYDLARDPDELTNLVNSESHAAVRREMEEQLTAWYRNLSPDDEAVEHKDDTDELDEETKEALRSLGYLE